MRANEPVMSDELLGLADELYGLAPGDFTPARDAKAKELKGSELSGLVKKLKKPSVAAWVVNQLVRHETEQVEQILAMGEALRAAQAGLKGDELRALTRQRRQLTAAVTTQARSVASDLGVKVTQAVADQVEATLTAAMVDEECARAVRSGLLVAALASTGVGEADVAGAVATPEALGFAASPRVAEPEAPPDLHVVPDPEADQKAQKQAQKDLEGAEERLAEASEALGEAAKEVSDLEARSMQLQAQLDELRGKIADLEARFEEVDEELADAEEVRAEAESTVAAATKDRDSAAAALAKLR
jgi:peptidoglycan hydrolase CwlO-like protein